MKFKGQTGGMEGAVMAVIMTAVVLVMGVLIYNNIQQSVGNQVVLSERLGNVTTVGPATLGPRFSARTVNSPIYFGVTQTDGTANATARVIDNSNQIGTLTLTCCQIASGSNTTFNITASGLMTTNTTTNGTIFIDYTIERLTGSAQTSIRTISDTTYNSFTLAAVGLVVLAAVAILGIIAFLGSRA